jgi:hypothetical protein
MRAFTRATVIPKMNTSTVCEVERFTVETESHCVLCEFRAETTYVVHSTFTLHSETAPGPLVSTIASCPPCPLRGHPFSANCPLQGATPLINFNQFYWDLVINRTRGSTVDTPVLNERVTNYHRRAKNGVDKPKLKEGILFHPFGIPDASRCSL